MYRSLFKPLIDFLLALIILVILSPFIMICMLVLAFANRGRVWFVQRRPGRHEKPFHVIKFRTMHDVYDEHGNLLDDEHRLTGVGKIIRKTSLDELPQLFCVLTGKMALVGPRPLLIEYIPLYNDEQRRRHEVRPGITGWAQVNGRNAIGWQEKFRYDVWYADHLSFWLDVKILILTLIKVLTGEGISSATSVTMEKFRGNS